VFERDNSWIWARERLWDERRMLSEREDEKGNGIKQVGWRRFAARHSRNQNELKTKTAVRTIEQEITEETERSFLRFLCYLLFNLLVLTV
jgi:hypothetical protein